MLNNVIPNSGLFYGLILLLIPTYTWIRFFKIWAKLENTLNSRKLFHDRHNCVVMYSKERGITGWPNHESIPTKTFARLDLYDSIMYFIETAEKSLNVALMVIDITALANALIKAHKRGVKVRVLVDHSYSKKTKARDLENSGIQVLYYVCPDPTLASIMHYKYMLKDYCAGHGCVYMGSLNWTTGGIQENYENTVFTTDRNVVSAINENFEEAWKFVDNLCKNNSYVKAKLKGVQ